MLLSAAIWIPIAAGMLVLWAGDQRPQLLRWLASHDERQVKLLLGNHDAARVMELATFIAAWREKKHHGVVLQITGISGNGATRIRKTTPASL